MYAYVYMYINIYYKMYIYMYMHVCMCVYVCIYIHYIYIMYISPSRPWEEGSDTPVAEKVREAY